MPSQAALARAIVLPINAPATVSPGKWTPRITRDMATRLAHRYMAITGPPYTTHRAVASRNAAELWPEGKLNWSEAVIRLRKPGMKSCGRRRLRAFFSK